MSRGAPRRPDGPAGRVYLVGAGPGDPGLLTLRAARLLRRADVVVHDALVGHGVLDLVRPDAERIDVGKRARGRHTPQTEIDRILIDAARRARRVVRLKGGDPFVFGRGGEEALALREAGVRFEVVPGVTSAVGVTAYAGIPLTHRDLASAVTLVTGHECAGGDRVDWERLGRSSETLVVYMGVHGLESSVARLLAAGRDPLTPAAVIQWGTTARQRTVTAPLARLAERVAEEGVGTPALVVIGPVVALRERIAWLERRPLFGLRVLVPRSRAQPSRLARRLEALGAEVTEAPRLRAVEPSRPGALRDAVAGLARYRWLALTSPTAVERLGAQLDALGLDARALAGVRLAAFGDATASALRGRGLRPDVAIPSFRPEAAAAALEEAGGLAGERLLFLREEGPPSPLAARLATLGAAVDEVAAYREEALPGDVAEIRRRLEAGEIDVIAFASSRTVRRFVAAFGVETGGAALAAIGTETARTALSFGLPVRLVPGEQTLNGFIRGIREISTAREPVRPALPGAAARRPRLAPQP